MRIIKIIALVLVAAGIGVIFLDPAPGAEIPLLAGLFMLFVIKDKTDDERVLSIKTSAAYIALILGYGIKLLSTNLYSHSIISWQLIEINHFLILVFTLALLIYYVRLYLTSH